MSTQPRMSAPIGRVKIATTEGRKRRGSGTGRWRPVDTSSEADGGEGEEADSQSTHPPFYPFPLRRTDDGSG